MKDGRFRFRRRGKKMLILFFWGILFVLFYSFSGVGYIIWRTGQCVEYKTRQSEE